MTEMNTILDHFLSHSYTKTVVVCGFSDSTRPLINLARNRGLMNGDNNYIWMHPEPAANDADFVGIFEVKSSHGDV